MPKAPDWLMNLDQITARLKELGETLLFRGDVEQLFKVKRTEASRVMQLAGAGLTEGQLAIRADALRVYLEVRHAKQFVKEHQRRAHLVNAVTQEKLMLPVRNVFIKMEEEFRAEYTTFAELPPEIEISRERGELRIRFTDNVDLAERLVLLAYAMKYDFERYVELAGSRDDAPGGLKKTGDVSQENRTAETVTANDDDFPSFEEWQRREAIRRTA